jgi:hypothetical protein
MQKKLILILLKWICRKLSRQSHLHESNIVAYYWIMREATHKEFTEDSRESLDSFLLGCFNKSKQ